MSRHAGADALAEKRWKMNWTVALILALLWVCGIATSYTYGGGIHILLVGAILLAAFAFVRSRRTTQAR
jgi:hypothetical protein